MNNIINIHSAKAVDQDELDKILHEKEQKLKEELLPIRLIILSL